ncbi:oxygen-independent coproporphyrinogen III oxidase [Pseudobacteriovorax antillogorgiicola]|uniref:Coproporphyrinogen-III oxidase n=1 Tax=Pseudobacteriovorax antillogorgiicola TaxID=1513793 RepID=A0A1Y6BX19_9BACT|nr:oxygen-independent coproporphyrinogen III oxidase [Pseudobacteriovorax antillogorgiicola]TCS53130.1 anaerobic coproporphyrinogen III oxidase [Pseudobacteriovorax antillogorgiicola]SMF25386.1 coproporphyrinogen III oxidase, anaerobic [Pseudobacteriovorax antillogorgiicola]
MKYHLDKNQRETYSRYAGLALPRHTSYPAANFWNESHTWETIKSRIIQVDSAKPEDVSLYFHIPYCQQLCFYCACLKEVRPRNDPKTEDKINELLRGFEKELKIKAPLLEGKRVSHIHFGGGTPTYLTDAEWLKLWGMIQRYTDVAIDAEIAIEMDPRTMTSSRLGFFRHMGVNRISLGVQDFNRKVQHAINRVQTYEQVAELVQTARSLGIPSINFDLIYGLPFQTLESMTQTLDQVIDLSPNRVAFYRLAVLPDMFKWQKTFVKKDLPQGLLPLDLNLLALNTFTDSGYNFIGLDHFAKADDDLAIAYRNGALHRNFQGMTSGRDQQILGFGPSSISAFGSTYFQNPHKQKDWLMGLDHPKQGYYRCHLKSDDDRIRQEAIQQIYTYGRIDIQDLEDQFPIEWESYFSPSLHKLETLIDDGIVHSTDYVIRENGLLGRLLRRVIAAAFDSYLPERPFQQGLPGQASQVG